VNTSISIVIPEYSGNREFKYIIDYEGEKKW
jgi:hypothetical protein